MEPLADPPGLADEAPLARLCGSLTEAHDRHRQSVGAEAALAGLRQPPEVPPTGPLEAFVRRMTCAVGVVRDAGRRATRLSEVNEPPALADPAPLDGLLARRAACEKEVARLDASVRAIDAQLADVTDRVREWSAEHPTCPVCGSATDVAHILAGGHAHG
jgi:hypothetical protein